MEMPHCRYILRWPRLPRLSPAKTGIVPAAGPAAFGSLGAGNGGHLGKRGGEGFHGFD